MRRWYNGYEQNSLKKMHEEVLALNQVERDIGSRTKFGLRNATIVQYVDVKLSKVEKLDAES